MQLIETNPGIYIFDCSYTEKNIPKGVGFNWDAKNKRWWTSAPETAWKLIGYAAPDLTRAIQNRIRETERKKAYFLELSRATVAEFDVPSPDGLKYLNCQKVAIKYAVEQYQEGNAGVLLGDEMGCVAGDTVIQVNRGGKGFKIAVGKAFEHFNQKSKKNYNWDLKISTNVRALGEKRFIQHRVKNFLDKGEKEVLIIELEDGKKLKVTPDHLILTEADWKRADELSLDDLVVVNGDLICKLCGSSENIITYPYAKFLGYCKKCMYSKLKTHRGEVYGITRRKGRDGYVYLSGTEVKDYPRSAKKSNHLLKHVYLMEKLLGRRLEEGEEVHHKNRIRDDNRIENLLVTKRSNHSKLHEVHANFGNYIHKYGAEVVTVPKLVKVKAITNGGVCHVFDIVMEDPFRNFVANGIVVHNCGKSMEAIGSMVSMNLFPAILVVPASLSINWRNECLKWIPGIKQSEIVILEGMKPYLVSCDSKIKIIICNYTILQAWVEVLVNQHPKLIVFDEIHFAKSSKTLRSQSCLELVKHTKAFRLGLTGTPIPNRTKELLMPLKILGMLPKIAKSDWDYLMEFADGHRVQAYPGKWVWNFEGASNLEELQTRLRSTCFPYHTMIESEEGPISIGRIVENERRVKVLSVDLETSEVSWRQITAFTKREVPCRMVRIKHQDGEFSCTPDHRVWTEEGWVRAEALNTEMSVFVVHSDLLGKTRQFQILFDQVCCATQGIFGSVPNQGQRQKIPRSNIQNSYGMSRMWASFFCKSVSTQILQWFLCGKMELPPDTGIFGDQGNTGENTKENRKSYVSGKTKRRTIKRAFFQHRVQTKNVRESAKKVENKERRGFLPLLFNGEYTQEPSIQEDNRATYFDGSSQSFRRTNRSCDSNKWEMYLCRYFDRKNCNRSGWSNSCTENTTNNRQTKGYSVKRSRIYCTEILELGDSRVSGRSAGKNSFVYDIEVEGNHNFFANGVLVHNCMVRRLKSQVMTELPSKRRQVIELPATGVERIVEQENHAWKKREKVLAEIKARITQTKASKDEKAHFEAVKQLKDEARASFTEISVLRHKTALAKVPMVLDYLHSILDNGEKKVVLFGHHHDVLELIYQEFTATAVLVHGGTPMKKRQEAVERFQKTPVADCNFFVGSIGAMGTGHTLTASSHCVLIELSWVPGEVEQVEGRCHRHTQMEQVLIQYLVLEGSLDSRMAKRIVEKQEIINQALDEGQITEEEAERELEIPVLP